MLRADHERMSDLTHPELLRKIGGREKCIRLLDEIEAEMKGGGVWFKALTIERPPALAQAGVKWFGVVPVEFDMTGPGGARGKLTGHQFGESADGGRTWRFIDADGIGGDRRKLQLFMPDYPSDLPVPVNTPPRWDRG